MTAQTNVEDHLVINGKTYTTRENSYGSGWTWDAKKRILTLRTYHGTAISGNGSLTILISGIENAVMSKYGPAVHIKNGNLTLKGTGILSCSECDIGIYVENGNLRVDTITLDISAQNHGILTHGNIDIRNSSITIHTQNTGIKTDPEGYITVNTTALNITAPAAGIDCAGALNIDGQEQTIKATHGTALLIQRGDCTFKNCFARIAGCRYGILVQQGDLDLFSMTSEIAAEIGISAAGSFSGEKTDLFINGEETGLLVKGSTCIASSGNFGISGNTAITIDNDCIFTDMQITATGDRAGLVVGGKFTNDNTCISIRGEEGVNIGKDMIFSGHSLEMRGDTGLVVGGALIVTKGSITAVNDKNGIEIHGAYVQESGMVLGTGMSGNGIVVTRNIKISGGKLDAVGNLNGLSALGDFDILGGIITISGKCGLFVDGTLNGMGGYLTAFGDECGLYVSGGSAIFNGLSADIAGDIAVYVGDAMTAGKGALQISGHYCGILVDGGDLSFRNGIHDITADTYGMLLKKGSVHAESGRIHVTATGEDNNTSGICLESGDLIIDGALMTISGGADGVRVEAGDVKIMKGKLNTEGTVNGVVARGVCLGNGILTAYGTKDQALSLEQQKLISEKDTTIATEKNSIMTEKGNYNNQKYIHVYPDHYENITVPAEVSSLEKILPWMEGQLRQNGVPEIFIPKMHLVAEELFVNIANYAYPETKGSAEITMYLGPCLRLIFTDAGVPFDPLQVAEPDLTMPIEDRKTGGRGIFLSRKLTDEITYQRIDNRNVLTVYKQIYV